MPPAFRLADRPARRFPGAARRRRGSETRPARRGEAPLEFVMVLPLIVFFLGGILWMGFFMDAHSRVAVRARHAAWKHRDEPGSGPAYRFRAEDPVEEDASESVKFSIFTNLPPARSRHAVLVGAWDHRRSPLDSQPNWKLYTTLTTEAGRGAVQQALAQLNVVSGGLPDVAQLINEQVRGIEEKLSFIQQSGFDRQAQREAAAERDRQRRRADDLGRESAELGGQIERERQAQKLADERLKQLDEDLKDSTLTDDEREKLEDRRAEEKQESERARKEAERLEELRKAKDAERKIWEAAAGIQTGDGDAGGGSNAP
ncbi:MAG TPA: TadE/TadG family type IV pilus assembly protein [Pirellulales bacterium]